MTAKYHCVIVVILFFFFPSKSVEFAVWVVGCVLVVCFLFFCFRWFDFYPLDCGMLQSELP